MAKVSQTVVADSSFWIALFDSRDGHHQEALVKAEFVQARRVICPWPTLYEAVSMRFVKNSMAVARYEAFMRDCDVQRIDDAPYRDGALTQTIAAARDGKRSIALVDMVIRFMLDDVNVRSNYLITFNKKDFLDVCNRRRVELL